MEEDNFKICKDLDTINDSLPTLIIGWSNTKELIKEEISILHKEINDNLFWTFSPKERKVDYDKDIITFKKKCYNKIGNNIPYVYLDILHGKFHINKKIIQKIYTLSEPISYISKNNMLYIFGENIIFGVDLNICELIGINKEKIIERIEDIPNSILIGNEIFNKCKDYIKRTDNREKLVPYIYKNGEHT
jgi:hypothetical protein